MFSKIYKKSNKKGFTLTEMMIVIAIIVVLAGAGLTGIIVSYTQYKKYAKDMEEHGGIQFEADARDVIENLFNGFGTYKPRTIKINDPDPQPAVSPTPGGGGSPDPTSAPEPTSAPNPTSGPPPTSAPAPTTPPAPTQGGGGGGGGMGGPAVPANNVSGNANGVGFSASASNSWNVSTNSDKITFTLKDGSGSVTFAARNWGHIVYEVDSCSDNLSNSLGIGWGQSNGNSTNRQVGNGNWDGANFWQSNGIYLYH